MLIFGGNYMSFFSRLFGRETPPGPVVDLRPIAGQWYVGDLAVCIVRGDEWHNDDGSRNYGPVKGEVRRVTRIVDTVGKISRRRSYYLGLEGFGSELYCGSCFRKVVADALSADADFSVTIKACRPIRKRAEA